MRSNNPIATSPDGIIAKAKGALIEKALQHEEAFKNLKISIKQKFKTSDKSKLEKLVHVLVIPQLSFHGSSYTKTVTPANSAQSLADLSEYLSDRELSPTNPMRRGVYGKDTSRQFT